MTVISVKIATSLVPILLISSVADDRPPDCELASPPQNGPSHRVFLLSLSSLPGPTGEAITSMKLRPWLDKARGSRRGARAAARRRLLIESLEGRQLLAAADIVAENLLPGNPESEWGIEGIGTDNIQG